MKKNLLIKHTFHPYVIFGICFCCCLILQRRSCKGYKTYQLMDSKGLACWIILLHLLVVLVSYFAINFFFPRDILNSHSLKTHCNLYREELVILYPRPRIVLMQSGSRTWMLIILIEMIRDMMLITSMKRKPTWNHGFTEFSSEMTFFRKNVPTMMLFCKLLPF